MTQITQAQIVAAKDNDMDAITAVIRETEELVTSRANRYAGPTHTNGNGLAEELAQAGRIAVWQALSKFPDDEPAAFMTYLSRYMDAAMLATYRAEVHPGVSKQAAKDFETALSLAGGDPYEAERIATTDEMGPRKMSSEHAYAARLSWLGLEHLDRPVPSEDGEPLTLAAKLERETQIPAELITPADIASHRRTVIRNQVHRALGALSERQRHVLKAGFGVHPVAEYRPGVDDDELAGDMGVTRYQVQQARTKGTKRFSELYREGARPW